MIPESVIEKVLNQIDPEMVIDLTARLVRCNSVWDPQAGTSEADAAELTARWARDRGFDVAVETVAPDRPNVIIRWAAGPGPRTLMFEGHTDVVTPGNLSRWQYDPFGAQIEKGRMFGRGTNDTKGNLAAMLVAMAALKASGIPLAGSIVGGVLCDEEGMMTGVQHFIARGHADPVTAAVICEPQDGLVCITQKGAVRARFTVHGRMSHGAMPLSGLNPAPAVAWIIDGLAGLEVEAIQSVGKDPLLGWPSFTPTVVQAPSQGPPHWRGANPGGCAHHTRSEPRHYPEGPVCTGATGRQGSQPAVPGDRQAAGHPAALGTGRDDGVSLRSAMHPYRQG